jgi:hypothetical protein
VLDLSLSGQNRVHDPYEWDSLNEGNLLAMDSVVELFKWHNIFYLMAINPRRQGSEVGTATRLQAGGRSF